MLVSYPGRDSARAAAKNVIPPRIELGTFCVLGRCDNRYTTESDARPPQHSASLYACSEPAGGPADDGSRQKSATAGNRTRINCLEGNYANHYTTVACL